MITLFAGPSIAGLSLPATSVFDLRRPIQQGDLFMAALDRPAAIGIIDGFFEGVPSVWHKEILWAMAQGIPVFGASSMGALRAAELHAFGMIGVGKIFDAYRDEILEDDDEVALLHGPEEVGYPALTVAMVNVRATLNAALHVGKIRSHQACWLEDQAKAQFYKSRTWYSIFAAIDLDIMSETEIHELKSWVEIHEVDQKQLDAQLLIDRLVRGDFAAPDVTYHFEETDLWQHATQIWRERAAEKTDTPARVQQLAKSVSFLDE